MRFNVRKIEVPDRQRAFARLRDTRADEAGVAKMLDKTRYATLWAEGLKAAAANILKQEMLAIGADVAVARGVVNCSTKTTNVLMMGTRKHFKQLARRLKSQPFGLPTLGVEIKLVLGAERSEFALPVKGGVLNLSNGPVVMGAVNVTPDSFSDGGDNFNTDVAIKSALSMVAEGAQIIDIGGESSRPGAKSVGEAEELRRVIPVIEAVAAQTKTPISIDTYRASVARRAVKAGASIVNDISGLRLDPLMASTVADTGASLVVMHMRANPTEMQNNTDYDDLVGEVYALLSESVDLAVQAGVAREKIVVDPGIGFGKTSEGNLILLARLAEFVGLGQPILVGASRKSFIGKALGIDDPKDRLEGSLAAAVSAVMSGAHILRVHDVSATCRAAKLAWAIKVAGEE